MRLAIFYTVVLFAATASAALQLPSHLMNLGEKLFGSRAKLDKILGTLSEPIAVNVTGNEILFVQNKNDSSVRMINNEFAFDQYNLKGITSKSGGMIIDIGANIGAVSISAAKMFPNLAIIAIEPAPITYFYFRINLYLNKIPVHNSLPSADNPVGGVYPKFAAIATDDSAGTVTVRYSPEKTQFAVVGASSWRTPTWETAEVHKFNVNKLLNRATSSFPVELLKIDCEGCEFWLLPRISEVFSQKEVVKMVAGELHLSAMDDKQEHYPDTVSSDMTKQAFSKLMSRGCPTDKWNYIC
jgi:FkbM family methyltransferase